MNVRSTQPTSKISSQLLTMILKSEESFSSDAADKVSYRYDIKVV